jgi:protein-S-isoprenylcysteine O-methyltransferase Ste14
VTSRRAIGPILYGTFFVVLLPAGLIRWAIATDEIISLPAYHEPLLGWALAASGLALIIAGMLALRIYGGGLPMNAYPPPRYVRRGIYRWLRHPIYVGFFLVMVGVALAVGSASGLWLVSPVVALGMAALVIGYEGPDLRSRFGDAVATGPLLGLPDDSEAPPTVWDRLSIVALVFLPWAVAYEAVIRLGIPPDAVEAYLQFERGWPVLVWTEGVYASVYLFVVAAPFLARERRVLRHMAITALFATAVVTFIYVTLPLVAPPRPLGGGGLLGRMLTWERAASQTVATFPSFHVIWALIAAEVWTRSYSRMAPLIWIWAGAISVSCLTTGMHALVDVAAAVACWIAFRSYHRLWGTLRRLTLWGIHAAPPALQRAWYEWQLGLVVLAAIPLFMFTSQEVWDAPAELTALIVGGLGALGLFYAIRVGARTTLIASCIAVLAAA